MSEENKSFQNFQNDTKTKKTFSKLYSESSLTDTNIRKQLEEKDYNISRQTKQLQEKEEKELREFFTDLRSPVKEDPTLVRKKKYDEKMGLYKEVMESFDIKNLFNAFWNYQATTPEEIETLNQCRIYTRKNIFMFSMVGLSITTATSWYFRRELSRRMKFSGVVFGLLGGAVYGIINSTEYVLKRLESLGPDFNLGRLAIQEIEEYRLDKKLFKKI